MNAVDAIKAELIDLEYLATNGVWSKAIITDRCEQVLFVRNQHGIVSDYEIWWPTPGVCTVEFEIPDDNVIYTGDLTFTHLQGSGSGPTITKKAKDAYDRAMRGI